MIQYAESSMKSQIKHVWKECFHDEEKYIEFFLEKYFDYRTTLVYMEDSLVVSMLTLMPAKLKKHMDSMDVFYIYAVATLPEYQGKGYSSRLLDYVNNEKKDATFLMPASNSLQIFYERNGYHRSITKNSMILTNDQLYDDTKKKNELKVTELSASNPIRFQIKEITGKEASLYKNIRDRSMNEHAYIEWPLPMIRYAIEENAYTGGKTVLVNDQYVVMYRKNEGVMYIREHTMPDELIIEFTRYLMNHLNGRESCVKYCISLFSDTKLNSNNEQVVMTKFKLDERNAYFNLAFE